MSHFGAENSALRRSVHDGLLDSSANLSTKCDPILLSGRYGDRTQWLINLDVDEFMIPEGEHESIASVLRAYDDEPLAVLTIPMQVTSYYRD